MPCSSAEASAARGRTCFGVAPQKRLREGDAVKEGREETEYL